MSGSSAEQEEVRQQLTLALEQGRADALRHVLDHQAQIAGGADGVRHLLTSTPMQEGNETMSPLHYAMRMGHADAARMLVAAGADLSAVDSEGRTPVDLAKQGHVPDVLTSELFTAVARDDVERVTQLLSAGLTLDGVDNAEKGNTCLHWAASLSQPSTVELILAKGADVNARNACGATPLHDAAKRGDFDVVQMLLAAGATRDPVGVGGAYAQRRPVDMITPTAPNAAQLAAILHPDAGLASAMAGEEAANSNATTADANERATQQQQQQQQQPQEQQQQEQHQNHEQGGEGVSPPTSSSSSSWFPGLDRFVQLAADSMEQEERERMQQELLQKQQEQLSNLQVSDERDGTAVADDTSAASSEHSSERIDPILPQLSHPLQLLWPQPRQITQFRGRPFVPTPSLEIYFAPFDSAHAADIDSIFDYLTSGLKALGHTTTRTHYPTLKCDVTCRITAALARRPEAYRVVVDSSGVILNAGDVSGLRHACTTLLQLLRLCCWRPVDMNTDADATPTKSTPADPSTGNDREHRGIPPLRIHDFPDFPNRGFMLDVSRDKVPTMATLYALVDLMASLKMNQLQLYMEHTFAYAEHRIVWEGADPYTPSDICALDRYCRQRGIALVPNQNSLGHFHRFLKHDRYRHLAECPEGINFGPRPSGPMDAPFSLSPIDLRSISLISSLYSELFPNFTSSSLAHVGLDETVDIGQGVSHDDCARDGPGAVYLAYLQEVRKTCLKHNRTMMFWADMLHDYESAVMFSLPSDVIAMEWGYEELHPFEERCELMADAGVSFYVCPGTSSWNSLTGRVSNCIANIRNACEAALKHEGLGVLLTDWGDFGHTQPLCLSYPGIVTGAGFSWRVDSKACIPRDEQQRLAEDWRGEWGEEDLAVLIDHHVFHDEVGGLGHVLTSLGNLYLHAAAPARLNRNGTFLFRFLNFHGPDTNIWDRLNLDGLKSCTRELRMQMRLIEALADRRDLNEEAQTTVRELGLVSEFALFACRLAMLQTRAQAPIASLELTHRTDLANRLIPLLTKYKEVWMLRNREGGFKDSVGRLNHTLDCLLRKK
ncbi:hypothetical protein PTSG_02041 [Salpingoeca rosetta]|uniref:beta-N-acetylhexosaminidase n=1 Tax=Salpingoeca rosetta (strain ATCC 50818 / BSB-021) TaxID=946362 RepID=F2TZP9_SALR5|nr:uncharacterized protein PTSG_02041 [Salpingoeca rosetta]EGD79073.1 hypothetical protein PTSG_02041 [Salpingoeca rosetta]|eukprot:XP_004998029.1 hypothetical protein PTSG_02041 [Salpingoeca rosetta]